MECEKLASEKIEIQRHYVMYYEMSYGLNVEMHKQTEIAKRLNAIIAQILPFLNSEHQQQVATAVDRAKQVTMTELNAIIGQQRPDLPRILQQMHAGQLPHAGHAPPLPMMPHPGLPGPPATAASLLGLSASLAGPAAHPLSMLAAKPDLHREETKSASEAKRESEREFSTPEPANKEEGDCSGRLSQMTAVRGPLSNSLSLPLSAKRRNHTPIPSSKGKSPLPPSCLYFRSLKDFFPRFLLFLSDSRSFNKSTLNLFQNV
ncbi:unnamed protein product [Nezara viridula]|uniref:Groucho/TLE N-terminal Q-rich domain-containing protein n=1 Tax=Nezara viridula TaxID=85310 RepID=A0A9P0MX77_NEZVI|nr:unnamed protein product [Nezara viridula]